MCVDVFLIVRGVCDGRDGVEDVSVVFARGVSNVPSCKYVIVHVLARMFWVEYGSGYELSTSKIQMVLNLEDFCFCVKMIYGCCFGGPCDDPQSRVLGTL